MNDIPLSILFGILIILILLSAFFSGSETALMTLNRYRLQHLVKKKHAGATKAYELLQRPDRLIGLILLGNNFVNILASSLATVIAIQTLGESGIALAAFLLTLVILIFAEVAPKTLAAFKPEILAFPAAWILKPLLIIFYPLVWLVNLFANLFLKIFGIKKFHKSHHALSKEELKTLVAETGSLMPARYQNMLLGILDMESATVEDIMTPRNEIVGIDLEDDLEHIIEQLKSSPHTRLPVYRKSIDRVAGFLHIRKALSLMSEKGFDKQSITDNLIEPFFIPESTPLHKQIQTFKTEKLRIGLVVDEYGDVQGLVSLDDLLQEIIGELVLETPDIRKQKDGSQLVEGSITIRDLNRINRWSLPIEGPKTLNGLIIEYLETIPEAGTSVKLYGYSMEIVECDNNAVRLVKFYPQQPVD
ncbi:MAG: HlyC/CorC family transporter [Gammaproteobacteria bacterium]